MYAKEKGYPFLILTNSFEDVHRPSTLLKDQHLLNIRESLHDTEQAWVDGHPIWFHHGRGGYRPTRCLDEWIKEAVSYLKSNKGTPIFPPTKQSSLFCLIKSLISFVVVDFPFVPVIANIFSFLTILK